MTAPSMRAIVLGALAAALLLPGCLNDLEEQQEHATPVCDLLWHPDQVPSDARDTAGPGPREITITVQGADGQPMGGAPVAVTWQPSVEAVHVIHLRTTADGEAVARVPTGHDVDILSGWAEWTHEGHVDADDLRASVLLTPSGIAGTFEGAWDMPVAQGAIGSAVWAPTDLPWADADHIERLEQLLFILTWQNTAQGGADFGIAVGPYGDQEFHYTNREYQATIGAQTETRVIELAELESFGWDEGSKLQAGPSISTGGFSATGIPYSLHWQATFAADPDLPDRCLRYGDATGVDESASTSGSGGQAMPSQTVTVTPGPPRLPGLVG